MPVIRYEEILNGLSQMDEWLATVGVDPKNNRFHRAVEIVRGAHNGWRKLRETGQPQRIGNIDDYYFGIVEALEFYDFFNALKNEDPRIVAPKLSRALSGPLRPADETKENSDGRNMMFELSLAAEFRMRGVDIALGDPDVQLTVRKVCFHIECKRPFSEHSLRANIRGAIGQLEEKLEKPERRADFGLVAISVSRILNPGTKLFVAPNLSSKQRLGDQLERMMHESKPHWASYVRHPRIVAILFHIATAGVVEDEDRLYRMTFTTVMPVGSEGPAFQILKDTLPRLYEE